VSGDLVIKVTNLATDPSKLTAIINGIFIDPPAATAQFLNQDTTTQGNWIGAYGTQGYDIAGGPVSLPNYASITTVGALTWTSAPNSDYPGALQVPGTSNHIAAVWYSTTSFTINVDLTDGQTHDLALYAADYNSYGRSEQIQVMSADTGAILDTQTISNFFQGVYLNWVVSGDLVIKVTNLATDPSKLTAIVNGIFVDPGS
jgi:hypothetical protein